MRAAAALAALPAALAAFPSVRRARAAGATGRRGASPPAFGPPAPASPPTASAAARPPFDPWIEIDPGALRHNAAEVARAAGGRPILAVVKNNAYGLGLAQVGRVLERSAEVDGLAVVTAAAAWEALEAGVTKPILLMARADDEEAETLVARGVRLATIDEAAADQVTRLSRRLDRPIPVHVYLDTGMNRVGIAFRRAIAFLEVLATSGARVEGMLTDFTETDDFDPVQLERLRAVVRDAGAAGHDLGRLHAASSHGLFFRRDALLDMVRPGLVLYGAYPAGTMGRGDVALRPAFRLKARVARVERLEAGDGVSYGRNYVATGPTWVATLPVGHADGYPRGSVNGCVVWSAGRTYPVVGAVSASHTIIELGAEPSVRVGQEGVLIGPDHPDVHPNAVADRAGVSVYDVLMHLGARLPRRI